MSISAPSGQFGLDPEAKTPHHLLLVGAGSGLSPLLSIARAALESSETTQIVCLVGNHSEARMMLTRELDDLTHAYPTRLTVHHTLSKPSVNWTGRRGRIDSELIHTALKAFESPHDQTIECFLCGPTPMMDLAATTLSVAGIKKAQIHSEAFTPTLGKMDASEQSSEPQSLKVVAGDKTFRSTVNPGETILEAALRSGIPLPYSCAVGGCGACKMKLTGGQVYTPEPNCLTQEERESGCTLTCIGRAQSGVVIEVES